MSVRLRNWLNAVTLASLVGLIGHGACSGEEQRSLPSEPGLQRRIARIRGLVKTPVLDWKWHLGDVEGAERLHFDDSSWQAGVGPGFTWNVPGSVGWFRKTLIVPARVNGFDAAGSDLYLLLNVDDDAQVFVDGRECVRYSGGRKALIASNVEPGERHLIAVRAINQALSGQLRSAELWASDSAPVVASIAKLLTEVELALDRVTVPADSERWRELCHQAATAVDPDHLASGDRAAVEADVRGGQQAIAQLRDMVGAATRGRLSQAQERLRQLHAQLEEMDAQELVTDRPAAVLAVAGRFLRFARDDLASEYLAVVLRGEATVNYVLDMMERAGMALQQSRCGKRLPGTQLRYRCGAVDIRDGVFWQGRRPLFFTGVGLDRREVGEFEFFKAAGINIVQMEIGPSDVLASETEVNEEGIEVIVRALRAAAENDVAVDVLLSPHYYPAWAAEKYPATRLTRYLRSFIQYDIQAPESRRVLSRFWHALIPRIKGEPALISYCLANEPVYLDYAPGAKGRFRAYLERQHGTIERLNQAWGSSYGSFAEIPIPYTDEKRAPWWDWCRYNQEVCTEWFRWMRATIGELDPLRPIHIKTQGGIFDDHLWFAKGVDHEAFARIGEIAGNDNFAYYRREKGYAARWTRCAMYADYQRSVAPQAPTFNSENHIVDDSRIDWVSVRHCRAMHYLYAILGQGASTAWRWYHPTTPEEHPLATRASVVEGLATTALDLTRLSDEIACLQGAPAEVALVVEPASLLTDDRHIDTTRAVYEGLFFRGTPLRFVTDRQLREGRAAEYKLLVVAAADYAQDSTVAACLQYARSQGQLLLVGRCFGYDEYGRPRPDVAWPNSARVTRMPGGLTPEQLGALLAPILDAVGVAPPVRVANERREVPWGVYSRAVQTEYGYLVALINLHEHERVVQLLCNKRIRDITDLFERTNHGPFVELEPLQCLLLRVETADR